MEDKSVNNQRRKRTRLIWSVGILLLLAGVSLVYLSTSEKADLPQAAAPGGPPKGMPVEAANASAGMIKRELSAVGNLQSNESVVVASEIVGRVAAIGFDEGKKIAAGKVLLKLDPSVLAAERDRAQASLGLSEVNQRRAEILLKDNAISERERDEAYAKWRLDEASLRLAEAQLAKTVLLAPFDGIVGLRKVSVGDYLQPGEPIANLEQIDPIKVDFRIPETFAGQVEMNQNIHLTVDAVPGQTFSGTVYAVDPLVDVNGRSMLLRARVANADGRLRPGMFARIAVLLEERADALTIPEEALIPQADGRMSVFKVVDGKVEAVQVRTGLREKGRVEIIDGLQPGDTVITAGHMKVRPGMPVTVLPSPSEKPQAPSTAKNGD
jgi:membrane fusion protein (multidrug efflux system)